MSIRTALLAAGLLLLIGIESYVYVGGGPEHALQKEGAMASARPALKAPSLDARGRRELDAEHAAPVGEATALTRSLTGVVLLPDGKPARGFDVVVGDESSIAPLASTLTDECGRFRLEDLPLAARTLHTSSKNSSDDRVGMFLLSRDVDHVRILTHALGGPDQPFVFRVRGPKGEIVGNCHWTITSASGGRSAGADDSPCDESGWVRMLDEDDGIRGQVWIHVWNARDVDGQLLDAGSLLAGPYTSDDRPVLFLPIQSFVLGHVLDLAGQPLAGVDLVMNGTRDWPRGMDASPLHGETMASHSAKSDETGAFRIGGIGNHPWWLHVSQPPGYAAPLPIQVNGGEQDVTIRLPRAATARITVTDPGGLPVAGARVEILDTRFAGPARVEGLLLLPRWNPGMHALDGVVTDKKGTATALGLDPRVEYVLIVVSPNSDLGSFKTEGWRCRDTEVRLVQLESISGVVVDEKGKRHAWAGVTAVAESGQRVEGGSGADGRFTLENVPQGKVTLTAVLHKGGPHERRSKAVVTRTGKADVVLTVQ